MPGGYLWGRLRGCINGENTMTSWTFPLGACKVTLLMPFRLLASQPPLDFRYLCTVLTVCVQIHTSCRATPNHTIEHPPTSFAAHLNPRPQSPGQVRTPHAVSNTQVCRPNMYDRVEEEEENIVLEHLRCKFARSAAGLR